MASSNMAETSNTSRRHLSPMQDHCGQVENTTQGGLAQYRELLHEFRNMKSEHQDELTQYKIKIAVLENELGHVRQEKESGMASLRVAIEVLTGDTSDAVSRGLATPSVSIPQASSPSTQNLPEKEKKQYEAEIERLRRENRSLKQKVSELERCAIVNEKSEGQLDKDKDKENLVRVPSKIEFQGLKDVPTGPKTPAPDAGYVTGSMLVGSWEDGKTRDDDISTEPKSPILAVSNLPNFDIGLNSLEDNLNEDGVPEFDFAKALAYEEAPVPPSVPPKEYPELEKGIDEQLADEEVASRGFLGPAPTILKTGFQVGGNKRGEDYDPSTLLEAPRTYTRSRCIWRDPYSSSNSSSKSALVYPGTDPSGVSDRPFDDNLWNSIEEREEAIRLNKVLCGRGERKYPDFFRYGIQFTLIDTDENFARTVHVSNLPESTELREVLPQVRGGEGGNILSATMLQTMKLTNGLAVRIVFLNDGPAKEYVSYVAEHPITFGNAKQQAVVELIDKPTYPLNLSRRAGILKRAQTRCVAIPEFPLNISLRELERVLACRNGYRAESLVEMWIDEAGTLHLEFSSVDIAGSACRLLRERHMYGYFQPEFERDPCAGPLEELKDDIPPRRPMFPRSRQMSSIVHSDNANAGETGSSVPRQAERLQRKRLAAFSNQKVEIPSFSDVRLKSRAWADMMDDDEEDESPKEDELASTAVFHGDQKKPDVVEDSDAARDEFEERVDVLRMDNLNKMMFEKNSKSCEVKKRPIGLAGSKYASLEPEFDDGVERPRGRGAIKSATTNRSNNDLGPSLIKNEGWNAPAIGLGIRITEEAARKQEAESEYMFNMYTRHGSFDHIAVRPPELDPHPEFESGHDYGRDSSLSRSPPRVDLRKLLGSSSDSYQSSESDDTPSPTIPNLLPPFDTSLLDIYKSSPHHPNNDESTYDDSTTAKPSTSSGHDSNERESRRDSQGSVSVSSSTDGGQRYAVHDSPNNPVCHEIRVRGRGLKRQNTVFLVPPLKGMQSGIFERRSMVGGGTAVQCRDEDEGLMMVAKGKNETGGCGNDVERLKDGGEVKVATVVNPDEISLDDEDEDEG